MKHQFIVSLVLLYSVFTNTNAYADAVNQGTIVSVQNIAKAPSNTFAYAGMPAGAYGGYELAKSLTKSNNLILVAVGVATGAIVGAYAGHQVDTAINTATSQTIVVQLTTGSQVTVIYEASVFGKTYQVGQYVSVKTTDLGLSTIQ